MITISEYDFDMNSHAHGAEHTKRVMHLVNHLAKVCGIDKQTTLQAYCAAVIHDMAREHDGYCDMHGQWSVERKLPIWKDKFIEIGLKPEQLEAVAFAVHWHCKSFKTVPDSPHLKTLELLHDADALDRVRFGGPEAIRLDYLHFPETKDEIGYAEKLFYSF